jgi:lysyl-tRNA synthetase class I
MAIITMTAIGVFIGACLTKAGEKFSEKAIETVFESRKELAEKFTDFFKPEFIQLGLNESATPEEVTKRLEAKPEIIEQAAARLKNDTESFNALLEVLRETKGDRTTNIGTLKGNYIEENHGDINQDIS